MANSDPDERPLMAIAVEWSARLMTITLEIALPAAGGYWLDRRFHTLPILVLVGAMLGFVLGMYQLLQLARPKGPAKEKP